jgi:hypothetical protein
VTARSHAPRSLHALASGLLALSVLAPGCAEPPRSGEPIPTATTAESAPPDAGEPADAGRGGAGFRSSERVTERALAIAATPDCLYVVHEDGRLLRWDAGAFGAPAVEPTPGAREVQSAQSDVCVVTKAGEVHCRTDGLVGRERGREKDPTAWERAWARVGALTEVVSLAGSEVRFVKSDGESHGGPMWCTADREGHVDCWETPAPLGGPAVPKRVAGVEGATAVAVGEDHACAIVKKGKLRCWHHLLMVEGSDDPGPRPRRVEPEPRLAPMVSAVGRCLHQVDGPLVCLVGASSFGQAMSVGRRALFEEFAGEEGAQATKVRDAWGRRCRVFEGGRASCYGGWFDVPEVTMADVEDVALPRRWWCALRKGRTVDCHAESRP